MKLNKKIIVSIIAVILIVAIVPSLSFFVKKENKKLINLSTVEVQSSTEAEEKVLETEKESLTNQGDISYEGSSEIPNVELGDYYGLTYYSQLDSRWKSHPYTAIGDSAQTIGTSGCGATSVAMLVSSLRGNITPDQIGDLFVQYGYRSANSGTYLSAFKWTADVFNLNYIHTTDIYSAVELLRNNYYVIVSCGEGLFTYGGHIMLITGIDGDTLRIYDPYLYNGKFDTSTRAGKVDVEGTTVYCSIENFRKYANCTNYYGYIVNNTDNQIPPINNQDTTVYDKKYVKVSSYLNVRDNPNGSIVDKLYNNTPVTIYETDAEWSRIGDNRWVNSSYLSDSVSYSKPTSVQSYNKYTTGTYKVTASLLNVRTGAGTNYRAKTYRELSSNARQQNRKLGKYYANGYLKGVVCKVTKISGNFGYTTSGWISLDFVTKI
jgi:hypothetical protein